MGLSASSICCDIKNNHNITGIHTNCLINIYKYNRYYILQYYTTDKKFRKKLYEKRIVAYIHTNENSKFNILSIDTRRIQFDPKCLWITIFFAN